MSENWLKSILMIEDNPAGCEKSALTANLAA